MHKKLSGKIKAGKPIVIPPDVAALFGVTAERSNSKTTWSPEADMIVLTRLRCGHQVDERLPMTQFAKIFKEAFKFGVATTIRARAVKLKNSGITEENYAEKLAAGQVPD